MERAQKEGIWAAVVLEGTQDGEQEGYGANCLLFADLDREHLVIRIGNIWPIAEIS